MALTDRNPLVTTASARTPVFVYLAVLLVAILIIAGASTIWLSTDNSGTNVLATDHQAISPAPAPSPAN